MPDSLQSNNIKSPLSSPTRCSTTSSISFEQEELPIGYAPPSRARSSKLLHLSLLKSSIDIPPLPENTDEIPVPVESHLALNSNFIGKVLLFIFVRILTSL